MAKKIPLDPDIKKTLRNELRGVYLKQAEYIQQHGERSAEIGEEITSYRVKLGEDWKPKKKVAKGKRPPAKRKKAPWRCSFLECLDIIPDISTAYKARKKHYCSLRCALADDNKEKRA